MSKFYLVGGYAKRNPHTGLVCTGYYKQDPENLLEKPRKVVFFNRWPPVEMEADVVDVPLNGVYEYPSGVRVDHINATAIKTKDGKYYRGWSPQELVAQRMHLLKKVVD